MSIKILVISDYRDYHISRPEAEIFKGLSKITDFEIFIMTFKNSAHVPEFEKLGIKIIDFHPLKKWDKTEVHRIRKEIINRKIDILHLFNSKAIHSGTKAAIGTSVKVVTYLGFSSNVTKFDPFANLKSMHPRVDKVFCNSIGVAKHLHKQPFFNKSKTIVINKGHDIEWYKNIEPINIREELNIDKDALLLINVANNRKMKGVPYLIKAMNNLPKNAKIHLLIAGNDMNTKENIKIIRKGNRENSIHLLGHRKDVLNIVAACDAFVLPSIYGESITKSVLEAMSLGVPAIISDIPGNFELLESNISGLIFESKNYLQLSEKIMTLYNDRKLCKILGNNAKLRIKNVIDNNQTVIKTKHLYEELMGK